MYWNLNGELDEYQPRVVSAFLWLPKIIGADIRWMCTAIWRETPRFTGFNGGGYKINWEPTEWL